MFHANISRLERQPKNAPLALGGNSKRIFDILISAAVLGLFTPILLIVAVLVKLSDPGPVIFRHMRVGHGGRRFHCLKFRSMVSNSDEVLRELLACDPGARQEWERSQKLANDPRITPVGKFLRQTSLDELPQLINVIRGEMSLVGPRPIIPGELRRYGDKLGLYLQSRPGITGLWQVNGRSTCAYQERIEMDAHYVRNWSFSRDFVILLRTLAVVLARRGSY